VWPADGQAAFVQTGQSRVQTGPNQHAAAIASVAKVMTAYLVLRDHPLEVGQDGRTITPTDADVADTDRRRRQEESVVAIAAGEQLTERQALQALLLPSANNIAAILARWDAGSAERFVARMNATARSLGMTHTRYTDPSGYDDATVSTAADQVRIVDRAMRLPCGVRKFSRTSQNIRFTGPSLRTPQVHKHDLSANRAILRRDRILHPTRSSARRDLSVLLDRSLRTRTTVALSRAEARELAELLRSGGFRTDLALCRRPFVNPPEDAPT
jgi:D-alanyl-D-alanine carboxypeptidase (penicillin-binding protein 5/6)